MGYHYYDVGGALLGFLSVFWLLVVAWIVLKVVAGWRIFQKAGQPGWASIIPFYNSYIEYKIYWGNGWLFLVPLVLTILAPIPVIGRVLAVIGAVIGIITKYKQSVAFGQGIGFTIGLVLLNPIFCMILGFGNYQYFGIPLDGFSYGELKNRYDTYKAAHNAQQTAYQQPDAQPQQPQYTQGQGPVYAQQPPVTSAPKDDAPNTDNTPDPQ